MKGEMVTVNGYTVETYQVDNQLSYSIAYEENSHGRKGNGGLRFYQYDNKQAQIEEAITLAKHMTQKHHVYDTGFSGIKIVANGSVTDENKKKLLLSVGKRLNQLNGAIYTGCDLNMNNNDMEYLNKITPYILNAIEAPQINTSTATAYGVLGSLMAVMDNDMKPNNKRILVHGVGKIGKTIINDLLSKGYDVFAYDVKSESADIEGVNNISSKDDWCEMDCDFLLLCSASNIITEVNVEKLNCRWIISSANSPFENSNVMKRLRERNIRWIPDVVSNAGAVICDSVEFDEPDRYKKLDPVEMYDCVYRRIYQKTSQILEIGQLYNLMPDQSLNIFLKLLQTKPVISDLVLV